MNHQTVALSVLAAGIAPLAPIAFSVLHSACLMVVGRWRHTGWCIGLTAQLIILGYAITTGRPEFGFSALPIAAYAWLLATRRGESWRGIPTPRELARLGTPCGGCCVHGQPVTHVGNGPSRHDLVDTAR